jgi:hypothetical protein
MFPSDAAESWSDFELIAGALEVIAGVFGMVDNDFGAVVDGFRRILAVFVVGHLFFEALSSGSRGGSGSS